MKKVLLFIILVAALVALGYFFFYSQAETPTETGIQTETLPPQAQGAGDLVGTRFTIPGVGQSVELGRQPVDYGEGDNFGTVILLSDFGASFSAHGKEYLAATVAANTGGSGTFVYAVLFEKNCPWLHSAK